jgi:hypothetical protein
MTDTLSELRAVLERESDADDALRGVVSLLSSTHGAVWAGIAFVEEDELVLGPSAGTPDEARRTRVPISYTGDPVGELMVDGDVDRDLLEQAAALVSPLVLIGWDTGGEAWEP